MEAQAIEMEMNEEYTWEDFLDDNPHHDCREDSPWAHDREDVAFMMDAILSEPNEGGGIRSDRQ
jgi:hypothetical protein